MSLREEFVKLRCKRELIGASSAGASGSQRRPATSGFSSYAAEGSSGLEDRSRRPRRSPKRTVARVEEHVLRLRREVRGCWGGRKLARRLVLQGGPELAPSTITGILRRHGLLHQTARRRAPFSALSARRPTTSNSLIQTNDLNSKCVTYVPARSVTYLPSPYSGKGLGVRFLAFLKK